MGHFQQCVIIQFSFVQYTKRLWLMFVQEIFLNLNSLCKYVNYLNQFLVNFTFAAVVS